MALTLHTLKSLADPAPKQGERVPGIRQLEQSGSEILARSLVTDMMITVYQNGYVSCQRGTRYGVFRLHDCGGYHYFSVLPESPLYLPEAMFENESWYIRLYLEAEDVLNRTYERIQQKNTVSYSDGMDKHLPSPPARSFEGLHEILEQENLQRFQEYFSRLTKKQQLAVRLYCIEGLSLEDCAAIYGADPRSVSESIHRGICNLMAMYGIKAEKISLSYHRSRRKHHEEE